MAFIERIIGFRAVLRKGRVSPGVAQGTLLAGLVAAAYAPVWVGGAFIWDSEFFVRDHPALTGGLAGAPGAVDDLRPRPIPFRRHGALTGRSPTRRSGSTLRSGAVGPPDTMRRTSRCTPSTPASHGGCSRTSASPGRGGRRPCSRCIRGRSSRSPGSSAGGTSSRARSSCLPSPSGSDCSLRPPALCCRASASCSFFTSLERGANPPRSSCRCCSWSCAGGRRAVCRYATCAGGRRSRSQDRCCFFSNSPSSAHGGCCPSTPSRAGAHRRPRVLDAMGDRAPAASPAHPLSPLAGISHGSDRLGGPRPDRRRVRAALAPSPPSRAQPTRGLALVSRLPPAHPGTCPARVHALRLRGRPLPLSGDPRPGRPGCRRRLPSRRPPEADVRLPCAHPRPPRRAPAPDCALLSAIRSLYPVPRLLDPRAHAPPRRHHGI